MQSVKCFTSSLFLWLFHIFSKPGLLRSGKRPLAEEHDKNKNKLYVLITQSLSFSEPLKFVLFNVFVFFLVLSSGIVMVGETAEPLRTVEFPRSFLSLSFPAVGFTQPSSLLSEGWTDSIFTNFLQPPQKLAVVRMRSFCKMWVGLPRWIYAQFPWELRAHI